jgi:hypothetical protein
MTYINPDIPTFKNYFTRDFPFGTDPDVSILDADIGKAYGQVNFQINQGLFTNQANYTLGYLWLSAHYLVIDMRASSQGIAGRYNWLESSKSASNLSSSFTIPQRILDNPSMAMLTQTRYGAKYLEMILPGLCGQTFISYGQTIPDGPSGPYGTW